MSLNKNIKKAEDTLLSIKRGSIVKFVYSNIDPRRNYLLVCFNGFYWSKIHKQFIVDAIFLINRFGRLMIGTNCVFSVSHTTLEKPKINDLVEISNLLKESKFVYNKKAKALCSTL